MADMLHITLPSATSVFPFSYPIKAKALHIINRNAVVYHPLFQKASISSPSKRCVYHQHEVLYQLPPRVILSEAELRSSARQSRAGSRGGKVTSNKQRAKLNAVLHSAVSLGNSFHIRNQGVRFSHRIILPQRNEINRAARDKPA